MTARELVELIKDSLGEEYLDCPLMFMDEVALRDIRSISKIVGNEYGTQPSLDNTVHIRLES